VERDVERVVERRLLRVEEVEPALDPLLDDRAGERLVDGEPVAIAAEAPHALGAGVDGEGRNRVQEEGFDVIAGHHGDGVGSERLEPLLDAREGRVHPQHQLAVLGVGSRQELRRVGTDERADQHGAHYRRLRPPGVASPPGPGRPQGM
jgi:hypothetical protein